MDKLLDSKIEQVSKKLEDTYCFYSNDQWLIFHDLGLIITPSFICLNPHEIKNEPYEVMLKSQTNQVPQNLNIQSYNPQQRDTQNQASSTLLLDTTNQHSQFPNR